MQIIKPTEIEKLIWEKLTPSKTGGLVRNEAFVFADVLEWDEWYREPDKMNPDDWERKLLAGCRGEWFAHVVEGRQRILDVGCGFGFPSFYLARYGHEIVGIDPSPSEIATAKAIAVRMGNPANVSFQVVEQSNLPFPEDSFDAATLSTSLECMGEPETILAELKRVLKTGSPLAIEEEDRSLEPETHPVWEKTAWAFFDDAYWIWYETRICDPYLDRRYMLKIDPQGEVARLLDPFVSTVTERKQGLPVVNFKEAGISWEQALDEVTETRYSEARGYDPGILAGLLERMGFTDIRFFIQPDGAEFARGLQRTGHLDKIPGDVRKILRALVRSMPATQVPVGTMVMCRVP